MPIEIARLLSKTRFFSALDEEQLFSIAEQMRDLNFRNGEEIFSRGDKGDQVFLIMEGRVRISILSSDGRELSFNHALPGELFGEIAVLDGSPRSASAMALSNTRLKSLSRNRFKQLLQTYPALSTSIIDLLCERMRGLSDHLEGISLFSIEIRLARYLLIELDRQKRKDSSLLLDITQAEIGMLLGASRPKVNVALATLEDSGAITREGDVIRCDRDLLEQASAL